MRFGFTRLGAYIALALLLASGGTAGLAEDTATAPAATATSDSTWDVTAATPDQIAAGKKIWSDAACFNCHGNNGQGGRSADFPRGPSLRTTALDPQSMFEIVSCGIPNTRMPAWAKGAYTERPCYGDQTQPAPTGTVVVGAFDEEQLHNLIAYIFATFIQKKQ